MATQTVPTRSYPGWHIKHPPCPSGKAQYKTAFVEVVVVTVVTLVTVVPPLPCPSCPELALDPEEPADPKEDESDCIDAEMAEVFDEDGPDPGTQKALTRLKPGLQELQTPVLVSADAQLGVTAVQVLLLR